MATGLRGSVKTCTCKGIDKLILLQMFACGIITCINFACLHILDTHRCFAPNLIVLCCSFLVIIISVAKLRLSLHLSFFVLSSGKVSVLYSLTRDCDGKEANAVRPKRQVVVASILIQAGIKLTAIHHSPKAANTKFILSLQKPWRILYIV